MFIHDIARVFVVTFINFHKYNNRVRNIFVRGKKKSDQFFPTT